MKLNKIIEVEANRAEIFNIFSALFCQPEEEFITNSGIYNALESYFSEINPECNVQINILKECIKKYNHQDLLIEYARLFIGPFKIEVPPYSSLYFDQKILMSDITIWVIEFYKSAGLNFDRSTKDLPDHIAVETEFIYYVLINSLRKLKDGELEKAKRYNYLYKYFFENHYKKWVPKFCDEIVAKSNNEFYKALASCYGLFIKTCDFQNF